MTTRVNEKGMVSLFVVIFSALLMTIITVGFIRVMIQDQQQAEATDLSKSALDSAYAGIEDAKRAIVEYKTQCEGLDPLPTSCTKLVEALNSGLCNTIQEAGIAGSVTDQEVKVQDNQADANDPSLHLDQAYTCVKITLDTADYLGSVTPDTSRLVHLHSDNPFDEVTIQWYSQQDLQNSTGDDADSKVDLYPDTKDGAATIPPPLPKLADWPQNRPALIRAQLLQYDKQKQFSLSDFNTNDDQNTDNSTLFLYPANFGIQPTDTTASFSDDVRQSVTANDLDLVNCDPNFSSTSTGSQYACSITIKMPNPVGATDNTNRDAYLRLNELYNPNTTFRITLGNSTNQTQQINFSAVQPIVDSTGRANDLFRRLSSRIDLEGSSIPDVQAAVDITGSLCKTFLVTDQASDYNSGACQDSSNGSSN